MPKGYHHLTNTQRCQLDTLKKRGDSPDQIAKMLNVHRSTIYREMARNRKDEFYVFEEANEQALERRKKANMGRTKLNEELKAVLQEKLSLQWSPEQISGRLKKDVSPHKVSHETIYKYVRRDKSNGGYLFQNLRHRGKKYVKRASKNAGRGCIPGRVDIQNRPAIVEKKERLGDWELDTIIGKKHQGAIVTMVDRASKMVKLVNVPHKTAKEVSRALIKALKPFKKYVLTLTSDNGKEFAGHAKIGKRLKARFFFATPYHSWERGLNEHTNGLVRQYLPKSTSFKVLSHEKLQEIEDLLNNRPRKILNYLTPIEMFHKLRYP